MKVLFIELMAKIHFKVIAQHYIIFYEDRDDIPSNMIIPWKNEIGNPIAISAELVKLIEEIFSEAFIEDEDQHILIAEQAISSSKFESFLSKISQLEKVVLNFKNYDEGLWFF